MSRRRKKRKRKLEEGHVWVVEKNGKSRKGKKGEWEGKKSVRKRGYEKVGHRKGERKRIGRRTERGSMNTVRKRWENKTKGSEDK